MTRHRGHKNAAQREADAKRQDEISAQTQRDAADLRWNTFVDAMVDIAAVLASRSPAQRTTASSTVDDTREAQR
jgi:hypothetical protein